MTQYYEALEFVLGNSGTKLPAQCMLGRRGEFEGLADWLSVRPLWVEQPVMKEGRSCIAILLTCRS